MITIEQLRYVRFGTADLAGATDFAERILGLQLIDKDEDQAFFRSDYRDHTLVFVKGADPSGAIGMEVRDLETLDQAASLLQSQGYCVSRGDAAAAAQRKVKHVLSFSDNSGNAFELVVRPLQSGWRYFASRDAGVIGLEAVAVRSTAIAADEKLWTTVFNGCVSDWVGDAAYIRFDDSHHRLALHPSGKPGVLAVEYGVEDVDLLMQNSYFLRLAQVSIMDGPGRRPTSGQLFLTFAGPGEALFSYVAEGAKIAKGASHRPRQFPKTRVSFCCWGSDCHVPEMS